MNIPVDTLVLAGQSTNAIAVLGALQSLYDRNILSASTIKRYVGTSSGAIVGILLAIGYSPLDLFVYVCAEKPYRKLSLLNISNLILMRKSLTTLQPISSAMNDLIKERLGFIPTLKELYDLLKVDIVCVTYDLTNDVTKYISHETDADLSVVDAAIMSSSFPLVFEPFESTMTTNLYIDGGITDNFATDFVIDKYPDSSCLGVVITNESDRYEGDSTISIQLMLRLLRIFIDAQMLQKIIRAEASGMQMHHLKKRCRFFDFDDTISTLLELFDDGYDQVSLQLKNKTTTNEEDELLHMFEKNSSSSDASVYETHLRSSIS